MVTIQRETLNARGAGQLIPKLRAELSGMYPEPGANHFGLTPADVAVRPVTLIGARPSNRARVVEDFRLASVIGRADVAQWLLSAVVKGSQAASRTPMIGWSSQGSAPRIC
jgi:hypothetical protein